MVIKQLKQVTASEARDIKHLFSELSLSGRKINSADLTAALKSKQVILLALYDGKRIIGMGTLVLMLTVSGLRGHIDDIVVDSEFRGRGFGGVIIRELIKVANGHKVKSLELTSSPVRRAANKLYIKFGFKKRETNVYNLKL